MIITEAGREFTFGVIVELGKWFIIATAVGFLANAIASWAGYGWDNTDNRSAGWHSNVRLRTDYGTGCQYLESSAGSLTPRLDRSGRQVCRP